MAYRRSAIVDGDWARRQALLFDAQRTEASRRPDGQLAETYRLRRPGSQ